MLPSLVGSSRAVGWAVSSRRSRCPSRLPLQYVLPRAGSSASSLIRRTIMAAAVEQKTGVVEARLAELGINLPQPVSPKGNYALTTRTGNVLFLAGHIPLEGSVLTTGKVGADVSVEQGYQASRLIAINILATLKAELGALDRVKRILKLTGFVACVDGFAQQPSVINGASDLFVEVLGPKGVHARSAVGTNALPLGVPVEIEAIVEIED